MPWLTLLLVALSTWFASPALACTCVKGAPPQELYGGVFEGKVTRIEMRTTRLRVTFDVARAWHDVEQPTLTVTTGLGEADCGYPFVEGESYLVFATGEPDWLVGSCSATQRLRDADVDALGEPTWTREDGLTVSDAAVSDGRDASVRTAQEAGASPQGDSGVTTVSDPDSSQAPKKSSDGCAVSHTGASFPLPFLAAIASAAWAGRRRRSRHVARRRPALRACLQDERVAERLRPAVPVHWFWELTRRAREPLSWFVRKLRVYSHSFSSAGTHAQALWPLSSRRGAPSEFTRDMQENPDGQSSSLRLQSSTQRYTPGTTATHQLSLNKWSLE